jgi:hypothetical protein
MRRMTMPGIIEFLLFVVGTAVVGRGCFLWGRYVGECAGCRFLTAAGYDIGGALAEGFDDRVDIVCNACGLVAVVECESCK